MPGERPEEQEKVATAEAPEGEAEREGDATRDPGEADGEVPGGADGEIQALNDRYLRLAAEYENYRKRTERERGESWVRAQAEIVKRLLDALDDLQRVAHYSAESTQVEALLEGVQMVERKLLRALESAGLEVIDATDRPFDPAVHEALLTTPTESREEDDTVGEVLQKGYEFKGVLLRPARVQVRKHEG